MGRTIPRSPANTPEVPRFLKPWQTPSLPETQLVRTGSRSWKSDEPAKLTVAGLALASAELQKGFDFLVAPNTAVGSVVPMPTETAAPLPLVVVPFGGLRMLTRASVVPERSPRRQAWVSPAEQIASPVGQSWAKRFLQ